MCAALVDHNVVLSFFGNGPSAIIYCSVRKVIESLPPRQAKETRSSLSWASIRPKEFSSGTLKQTSETLRERMITIF